MSYPRISGALRRGYRRPWQFGTGRQVFTTALLFAPARLLDFGEQPAAAIARERGVARKKGPNAFHDRPGRPAADESDAVKQLRRALEQLTEGRNILKQATVLIGTDCRKLAALTQARFSFSFSFSLSRQLQTWTQRSFSTLLLRGWMRLDTVSRCPPITNTALRGALR